ncbi:MAG TPA: cytochrome c maturation protein CcmE [Ktedonobacterales bacterium]|nr:cytochrome c maturation protein CcmE [Ktedonobacterales bacterium]
MQVESVARITAKPAARRGRRKLPLSFMIAGVAIIGAVLYLVVANTGASAQYYMSIHALRACTTCATKTIRVVGDVRSGSITRNDATQVVHFDIVDGADTMAVVYSGVVPDIFRAGVQVVVEGRLNSVGVFQARNLLAKCPSKFQSATPPA